MLRYAEDDAGLRALPDNVQRIAEGHALDVRLFLRRYEGVLESQRLAVFARRQAVLRGGRPDRERRVTLPVIDEHWSDYLAAVAECRSNTVWVSLGAGNPFGTYLKQLDAMFRQLNEAIKEDISSRLAQASGDEVGGDQRGETWTYLTVDEPFGAMTDRIMRGLFRSVLPAQNGRERPG